MAFQISPGVNVSEIDLTTIVPSVLTTAGAIAGAFSWGPANKITLVDSEISLVKKFGKPTDSTAETFFTAASFLAYGNNLSVVRTVANDSINAGDDSVENYIQIANQDVYQFDYLNNGNNNAFGAFMAKFPGALGSSLAVDVCSSSDNFAAWSYKSYVTSAPGTSTYASNLNGADDEMHIVVVDAGGLFTGTKGTVLEVFPFVSKASDAISSDGTGLSNYYKEVIFHQSKYVYAMDPVDYVNTSTTWGTPAQNTAYYKAGNMTVTLAGGADGTITDQLIAGSYAAFANKELVDISLILTAGASVSVQQDVIDLAAGRADCVAFISPTKSTVVNNAGLEVDAVDGIPGWLTALGRSSSYVVADCNWKYQLDVYNNKYRWTPLNGDVAGLCVYTDTIRDPWFSPAGLNRGAIKNCIKLAWNPTKTERDVLYAAGVNPVVTLPGQGTVLFGDKTLQSKPSAFDRINVRRLFIVLEKAISKAAQYSLFELNDEFTRAQFTNMVTPFLREIKGRRGIYDFKVVCDTTNNTPQVIDSNQFVGDIYIKPARSINFIQLNFIAVATGVDFNTVVGVA